MLTTDIVIGIDGGGSTTRALCADTAGNALAYVETGGANPQHNLDAQGQMHAAIGGVLAQARRAPRDVICLVAGIAGLNAPADQAWAVQHTAVAGLSCPRVHMNDAEVAHAGAFGTGPGIIAIAGTGSVIFANTDVGQRLWNDNFQHYAGAARHLAFATMQRVLVGEACDQDAAFIAALLRYWDVPDLVALQTLVLNQGTHDYHAVKRAYGGMAVVVTDAAATSPLAQVVCDEAASKLALGIRLLGRCFAGPMVPVVLVGGLARSAVIHNALETILTTHSEKQYRVIEPVLSPVAGAVLLALTQVGVPINHALTGRLRAIQALLT